MNDEPQVPADATLHRLMTAALGPETLSDEDIEWLLSSMEPVEALGDDQVHRVLSKVKRLLETTQDKSQNNVAGSADSHQGSTRVQQTRTQQPGLISIAAVEPAGRSGRAASITALTASMIALLCVVVMTHNLQVPRTVSQADQGIRTIRTLRHRHHAWPLTDRYHMTAKPLPERLVVARVSVGDEISTGELERRRVALPDGSVLT